MLHQAAAGSVVASAGCRNRVFTPSAPETILLSSGELASSPSWAKVPLGIDSALSFSVLRLPVKLLFPVREQTDDGQALWARPVPFGPWVHKAICSQLQL